MSVGTLLFRADASHAMGHGHVMRCLALAQAWQDHGGKCVFAMAEPLPVLESRLRSEDVSVAVIPASSGSLEDAERLAELARKNNARWVVVDGYQFGVGYQRALKDAGHKVLAIDDYGHVGNQVADIVLDQNAGAAENFYHKRPPYTRLLLGSRYAMLRREFKLRRNWKRQIPPTAKKILITMGGSDPENITERVLQSLALSRNQNFELMVLDGNPKIQSLRQHAGGFERISVIDRAPNMLEMMAWADIAIIAGGGTLWELLYMGCAVISFARNPVQHEILSYLANAGCVQFAGNAENLEREQLSSLVSDLASSAARREAMSHSGREAVDGLGAQRVCELMVNGDGIGNRSEADACVAARS